MLNMCLSLIDDLQVSDDIFADQRVKRCFGRSFAEGGSSDESLIESYGAPNKWPQAVTTTADAFEAAFGQQDSAVGSRIAANVDFNDEMAQMIALKATVGHMVPNFCSGNPGAIAAWRSAAHVESPPKKKVPNP